MCIRDSRRRGGRPGLCDAGLGSGHRSGGVAGFVRRAVAEPVSYTHLDVYKRQGYRRVIPPGPAVAVIGFRAFFGTPRGPGAGWRGMIGQIVGNRPASGKRCHR